MPLILNGMAQEVEVVFPDANDPEGEGQTGTISYTPVGVYGVDKVRVRVETEALCQLAVANRIVCNTLQLGGVSSWFILTRTVAAEAVYPYQGAR